LLLLLSFVGAGVAHTLWLRASWSQRFALPLDGGLTFRNRRLFGDNKTVRGLRILIPTVGLIWLCFGLLREALPDRLRAGAWALPAWSYAVIGPAAGAGFMLAELPNSFLKRQLDIAPGSAPEQPALRALCLVVDRFDSTLGLLAAVSLVAPVPRAAAIRLDGAGEQRPHAAPVVRHRRPDP
jgi:hypothetical protein